MKYFEHESLQTLKKKLEYRLESMQESDLKNAARSHLQRAEELAVRRITESNNILCADIQFINEVLDVKAPL